MAIKRGSKVDKSFSSASMTDLIFLLLLFMLIATTLINPNAIKLILPKSSNQLKDKAMTTISIQDTGHGYRYYVETENVGSREGVEINIAVRPWSGKIIFIINKVICYSIKFHLQNSDVLTSPT